MFVTLELGLAEMRVNPRDGVAHLIDVLDSVDDDAALAKATTAPPLRCISSGSTVSGPRSSSVSWPASAMNAASARSRPPTSGSQAIGQTGM